MLEEFLLEFQGCLMIVTHDRYFMDKLVDHLFVFEGDGKIKDFLGNYNDYRLKEKNKEVKVKVVKKIEVVVKEQPKQEQSKAKLSYKEKLEFEQLERDLETLETKKGKLADLLNQNMADHEELMKTTKELGDITVELDEKTDRWLALSEFV